MKIFQTNNLIYAIMKLFVPTEINMGGLLFYITENIQCKLINDEIIPSDIDIIMFEFLIKIRT